MRTLTTTPPNAAARLRSGAARLLRRGRGIADAPAFTPLIDAKAASRLLGVPHTWLLAQARAQRIPHHRLGHYVRFNPEDLARWLQETKTTPRDGHVQAHSRRL
ncbi:MAG TPA: helix-turn-helix domain-containing protein [Solirubrobacteraceae bacterium]|nr:helix-turn-helix domain-containing protein [Solirubrobacteraceae bacterium]